MFLKCFFLKKKQSLRLYMDTAKFNNFDENY